MRIRDKIVRQESWINSLDGGFLVLVPRVDLRSYQLNLKRRKLAEDGLRLKFVRKVVLRRRFDLKMDCILAHGANLQSLLSKLPCSYLVNSDSSLTRIWTRSEPLLSLVHVMVLIRRQTLSRFSRLLLALRSDV